VSTLFFDFWAQLEDRELMLISHRLPVVREMLWSAAVLRRF
jgi:hypothetical protein